MNSPLHWTVFLEVFQTLHVLQKSNLIYPFNDLKHLKHSAHITLFKLPDENRYSSRASGPVQNAAKYYSLALFPLKVPL